MSIDWSQRVAVVTGAAGAIGTEICLRLDHLGLRILAVDLRADGLEQLTAKLPRAPLTVAGDLTDLATLERVRATLETECGRCDLLINNAGMVVTEPFETAAPAVLRREIEVNLLAPMLLTRTLFPLLQKAGDGRVISVVSLGSILPLGESPGYSASKFGLRGLMLGLVLREPKTGVRISTVNPGSVDTPMLRYEAQTGGSPLNFIDPPLKPEQVAEVVLARLHQPRAETDVTAADGWLVRLGMLFPNLFRKVLPWFAKRGEKGRLRYLKEKGLEPRTRA
jgi:NAD(P)-dependent dehydrogenase (short-subunit alcohol dehydrogenase family)